MEATKSLFLETFGESPYVKTLDFFLTFPGFDYSKTQVAKEIGISRITMDGIWAELIRKGIIVKTRIIGRAELYKLNKSNHVVAALLELDSKLSKAYAEKQPPIRERIIVRK